MFTERLEFKTPKDCDAMPIYRCVDSNGNFLDENEESKFTKVFFYFEKEFLFGLGVCSKNLYGDDQVEHHG